ncbi:MAG: hypothetical protein WC641_05395 [Patescibacteria group bacterium]
MRTELENLKRHIALFERFYGTLISEGFDKPDLPLAFAFESNAYSYSATLPADGLYLTLGLMTKFDSTAPVCQENSISFSLESGKADGNRCAIDLYHESSETDAWELGYTDPDDTHALDRLWCLLQPSFESITGSRGLLVENDAFSAFNLLVKYFLSVRANS